ncbi:hypothetical protein VNI00_009020 [Paramarasmius palmivorus]|uniref:F-box domain-containing protein n=1 Tax=Paramarasmius palmivorus TaxID=297713 RepID=A0AAW0CSY4_9AGAR
MPSPPGIILCNNCNTQFLSPINHPPIHPQKFRFQVGPTNAELSQTYNFIEDEERHLARYERELERVRKLAEELAYGRDILKRRILLRKSWISPFLRVPNEVWCEVFTHVCLSTSEMEESAALFLSSSTKCSAEMATLPLTLSHVSFNWRRVITNLPNVWSTLIVDLGFVKRGRKKLIEMYLQNSADHPLSVRIKLLGNLPYANGKPDSALEMLMKASRRFKRFEFSLDSRYLQTIALETRPEITFPILESFGSFSPYGTGMGLGEAWFWEELRRAPMLRHVTIPNAILVRAREDWVPPNLASISIAIATTREVFDILTSPTYSRLTSFCWNSAHGKPPVNLFPPVVLPALRELSCIGIHSFDLRALFASFTLPALTSIEFGRLMDIESARWEDEHLFLALLERSKPPLKRLKLEFQGVHIGAESVVGILHGCPGLTDLEVWAQPGSIHELLEKLTVTDGVDQDILVPKLSHLRLHAYLLGPSAISKETQRHIVCMAESRSSQTALSTGGTVSTLPLRNLRFSAARCRVWLETRNPFISYRCEGREFDTGLDTRVQRLKEERVECSLVWIHRNGMDEA